MKEEEEEEEEERRKNPKGYNRALARCLQLVGSGPNY